MKNIKFKRILLGLGGLLALTAIIQVVGIDQALASANQITRKMGNIKSNLLLVTQAGAGIGTIIGLIIWNLGSPDFGKMIAKSGAVAVVLTFMFPAFESFLKTISGS
jgi:hypothetical protein